MTPMEHYREAEKLLADVATSDHGPEFDTLTVAIAEVHALLATIPKGEYLGDTRLANR